jgi:hypothetical protein
VHFLQSVSTLNSRVLCYRLQRQVRKYGSRRGGRSERLQTLRSGAGLAVPRVDHAITHTRPLQWRTATGTQIGSHGRKKSEREGGLPEIETAVVAAPVRLQERRRPDVGAARRDPSSPAAKMLRPSRRQDAPPLPQRLRSPPVARRRSLASGRSPPVVR